MSAPKPPEQLGIKIKENPKKRKKRKPVKKPHKASKHKSSVAKKKQPLHAEDFIPVRDIRNGIISISPASKQCINVCEIRKQDLSANQLIDGVVNENSILAKKIQQLHKLFSLVRNAEVSTVSLRNLTARTVRDDTAHFYGEVADLLGIRIDETHDWLKITVPAILPKRNQRDTGRISPTAIGLPLRFV